MSSNTTEKTVSDVLLALEGIVEVAPALVQIISTIKNNGQITLDELNQIMATRQAAVAAADTALTGAG